MTAVRKEIEYTCADEHCEGHRAYFTYRPRDLTLGVEIDGRKVHGLDKEILGELSWFIQEVVL